MNRSEITFNESAQHKAGCSSAPAGDTFLLTLGSNDAWAIDYGHLWTHLEHRDLLLQLMRKPYVVVIEKGHILSGTSPQAGVTRCCRATSRGQPNIVDLSILPDYFGRVIRGRIINNDHFHVKLFASPVLRKDRFQRFRQKSGAIMRGNDNTD